MYFCDYLYFGKDVSSSGLCAVKPSLRVPMEGTILGVNIDEKEKGDGQVVQNKEKRPVQPLHTSVSLNSTASPGCLKTTSKCCVHYICFMFFVKSDHNGTVTEKDGITVSGVRPPGLHGYQCKQKRAKVSF